MKNSRDTGGQKEKGEASSKTEVRTTRNWGLTKKTSPLYLSVADSFLRKKETSNPRGALKLYSTKGNGGNSTYRGAGDIIEEDLLGSKTPPVMELTDLRNR